MHGWNGHKKIFLCIKVMYESNPTAISPPPPPATRESKRGGDVLLAVEDSMKTEPFKFTSTTLELVGTVIISLSKNVLVCRLSSS